MGTATMRLGQGVVVSGSAANPNLTESDHSLVNSGSLYNEGDIRIDGGLFVSGGIEVTPGNQEGLRFKKSSNELNFISFQDGTDGGSYNARMSYNSAEFLFIAPGRGADFFINSGQNSGDFTFPFSIMDDGTARFEKGLTSVSDRAADLASDISFYVSGTSDGNNNAVFVGDVVVSGSLYFTQKYVHTVKFTHTDDSTKKYIRWNSNGVNSAPGVNNKWIAPVDGRLSQVVIRSTHTPGNTTLGFHRVSDGTENFSSSAVETQSVDLSTANTSAVVSFSSAASFSQGEVVGFSMDPTNAHGNVDISFIFELEFIN